MSSPFLAAAGRGSAYVTFHGGCGPHRCGGVGEPSGALALLRRGGGDAAARLLLAVAGG